MTKEVKCLTHDHPTATAALRKSYWNARCGFQSRERAERSHDLFCSDAATNPSVLTVTFFDFFFEGELKIHFSHWHSNKESNG